jgi:DNA-binding transcriptional regulator YiaG
MAKIESIIKAEIQRLAKREVRSKFLPLRREVWGMRLKLSGLLKSFTKLDRWAKEQTRQAERMEINLEATPEEVKASRFTPERIRNLRKKKGLSQRELAILAGVTIGAVTSWEKGKFKPKGNKKAALVALRKVSKREVKKILAEKAGAKSKEGSKERRPKVNRGQRKVGKKVLKK